jgi:outer membrane cobalamin receptor
MNRNNKKLTRLVLSAAIAATFASGVVFAQDATPVPPPAPTQDQATPPPATGKRTPAKETTALDAVVVTGNTANGGLRKIDTSYNITTATQEQIRLANPKSTADLLKISPGLWPESTGGQTGANIEIAGFPGGGDAPFNTVQMMGSPLYGMPTLSFFEQSSIFRLDDTIERVEIIQGGPSVVFADGQMGASENFILKTGSDTPEGSVGLTYGNEGLWRADAFYGFKIADKWYGSVGGFYRTSDGVRDPQFKADDGGQFTATLKHDFDNAGTLTLYARALNDKNQFITPIPLMQRGSDDFSGYPGFDPLTSTYYGKDIQHVRLPGFPGGGLNANLADGRGAKFNFFGGNYDVDFGDGWHISDKFLLDEGDADTNALFSGTNPTTLDGALYTDGTNFGGLALPAGSATATYKDGSPVAGNTSVIKQGWWAVHKHLRNINNDFRISKEIFEGNTLTAGLYLAHYTDDDKWDLGNNMLMTNTPHAKPIIVNGVQNGQPVQITDNQGFLDYGNTNFTQSNRATNKAFYLSDSWRSGPWLADLSIRTENIDAANQTCNTSPVNLDGSASTLYDNAVPVCNGTYNYTHYDKTHTSYTGGLNYEIQSNMSVYVRANKGAHFNDFDNGIRGNGDNPPPLQKIENFEGGFKYQSKYIYADISIYRKIFSGLLFTPTDINGVPLVGQSLTYGSASKGVNLQGTVTPVENFDIGLVANYMDGKYSHNTSCIPNTNQVTGEFTCVFINGEQLQRQPKFRYALTPSYRVPFGWGDVTAYVTYSHIGPHTQDQSGQQQLGTYSTVDFAIVANIQDSWQLRLQGTNITNELGLTESNSRIFGTAAGTDGVILARPLEGREINVQAKYFF